MRATPSRFLLFALCTLASLRASAITLRYAIVIGNNDGLDEDGGRPFPPLKHAEREAERLRAQLKAFSNFDPSPERTVLLTGATRAQLRDAVRSLAARKTRDVESLGQANTLFAFFFTGHGLNGRLLFHDGPLTGEELGEVFASVGADFNVGFFDACYSGSLQPEALIEKGVEVSPGNIFRELPEEVLTAEGSIWFASSGPDQVSYEDQELGGVFTHFFTEALARARIEGPGITLERIWHYARTRTVAHTSRHGRTQLPQQQVNLRSTGPLYFSFPVGRTATLVLRESVEGEFVLSYADGQLIERIEKRKGVPREIAVYPGAARMVVYQGGEVHIQEAISFGEHDRVVLRSNRDLPAPSRVGEGSHTLWVKGLGEQELRAEAAVPDNTWLVGAAYSFGTVPRGLLAPRHTAALRLRLDHAGHTVGAWVGYGTDEQDLGDWSYDLDALVVGARYGLGFNLGPVRLGASAQLSAGVVFQAFDDGTRKTRLYFEPGLVLGALLPVFRHVALVVELEGAAARLPGAGRSAGYAWRARGGLGAGVLARF